MTLTEIIAVKLLFLYKSTTSVGYEQSKAPSVATDHGVGKVSTKKLHGAVSDMLIRFQVI